MEAATSSKIGKEKNDNFTLWFDGLEIKSLVPAMTEEQFIDFCTENPNLRIEQDKNGNINIMTPVSLDSGNYESEVGIDLGLWNRKHKLGKTYSPSTLFILPDGEKRMADASWIINQKITELSKKQRKSFAHIVPDFIVEIRSPSDERSVLKKKIRGIWMKNGVRLAWLIDPIEEMSWIFRKDGTTLEIKGLDAILSGEDVLPGFEFDLSVLKD